MDAWNAIVSTFGVSAHFQVLFSLVCRVGRWCFFTLSLSVSAWQVELLVSLSAFALQAGDAQGAKTKAVEVSTRGRGNFVGKTLPQETGCQGGM